MKVMDRKEARKCDRYSLFAIDAAKQAIEERQWYLDKEDRTVSALFSLQVSVVSRHCDEEVLSYAKIKDTIGPKFNPSSSRK